MKRIFMALLAAGTLFVSCTKDQSVDKQEGGDQLIPVKFTVAELAEQTRVSGTAFEVGDQVGVFITKRGEQTPYVENVKFTVSEDGALQPEYPVYYPADRSNVSIVAYYPYKEGGSPTAELSLAADQSEELADATLYRADQSVTPSNDAVALNFVRALAKVLIYPTNVPSDLTVKNVQFSAAVEGTVDLQTTVSTFDDVETITPMAVEDHFEVILLPQTLAAGSKISLIASDGKVYEFTLSVDYILTAGAINEIELNMDPESDGSIDLSADGTSNCYIVSKAATSYKFKANVKGNGVAVENEIASISPVKARILWGIQEIQLDAENPSSWPVNNGNDPTLSTIVDYNSVTYRNGWVHFKTADQMLNGNIVICVTDASDNILWSWHIWAVKDYDADQTAQNVTAKDINSVMMDRNLGATCNPAALASPTYEDYSHARGLYYQWGRKDPFVHMRNVNGFNPYISWSDADGTITSSICFYTGAFNTSFVKANNAIGVANKDYWGAVNYVTANPMVFVANGSSYTWIGPGELDPGTTAVWGKLWGNQSAEDGGVKTMYDPCPVGWRVPDPKQLFFITSHMDNIGASYAKATPWKLNCKELIYDEDGNNVGAGLVNGAASTISPFTSEPYGLNFYIHGVKTSTGDDDIMGSAPADQTVSYFPAQGMIRYSGSYYGIGSNWNGNNVAIHTNAPSSSTSYGGRSLKMKACQNGDFYYNADAVSYGEQLATGLPVRCVKE